jgi:hypothetical protein
MKTIHPWQRPVPAPSRPRSRYPRQVSRNVKTKPSLQGRYRRQNHLSAGVGTVIFIGEVTSTFTDSVIIYLPVHTVRKRTSIVRMVPCGLIPDAGTVWVLGVISNP